MSRPNDLATMSPDVLGLVQGELTEDEEVATMQQMINDGSCWKLEGHMGRTATRMIENGLCVLGKEDHYDYWGNHVPSRTQVQSGTKGSLEYANKLRKKMYLPPLTEDV